MELFKKTLSVTEYNTIINEILTQYEFIVQGEVSNYKISQNKWVTFDLKDEGSRVNCFAVKFQVSTYLEDGMEIKKFSDDGFFVSVGANDKKFDKKDTADFLESIGGKNIEILEGDE